MKSYLHFRCDNVCGWLYGVEGGGADVGVHFAEEVDVGLGGDEEGEVEVFDAGSGGVGGSRG